MDPDPDPDLDRDPAIFAINLQDAKKILLIAFLRYIFTYFFEDKKSIRSHKTEGINYYYNLLFLLDDRRIRIRSRIRIHTSD
jgi:hypothetical protein